MTPSDSIPGAHTYVHRYTDEKRQTTTIPTKPPIDIDLKKADRKHESAISTSDIILLCRTFMQLQIYFAINNFCLHKRWRMPTDKNDRKKDIQIDTGSNHSSTWR